MNRIVVCLDCPHYQKGGYCTKTRKDVGALSPACDKAPQEKTDGDAVDTVEITEPAEEPQTTKKCERCGEVLPLSSFGWINAKAGRRKRRICKDCYHEAMRRGQNKNKGASEGHKICNICYKELPLSAFGVNKASKDGLMPCCKEGKRKVQKAYKERKKSASEKPRTNAKTTAKKTKPKKDMNTPTPTPAPVLNESIATMKTTTANPFSTFKDHELADELRARGYEVTATRTVTITL